MHQRAVTLLAIGGGSLRLKESLTLSPLDYPYIEAPVVLTGYSGAMSDTVMKAIRVKMIDFADT